MEYHAEETITYPIQQWKTVLVHFGIKDIIKSLQNLNSWYNLHVKREVQT